MKPTQDAPDVSVVLPMKNAAATVVEALDSVLASRGPSFEVIVLDHACADASAALVRSRADARVRLVDASALPALADVLNHGIALARAPLIARMDADDVMHPERLAAHVHALAHGALDAVTSCVALLPVTGRERPGDGLARYVAWQNACRTAEEHARDVWIEQPLCHPATTFTRAALARVGGYRAGPFPEDYDLFLRLLSTGTRIEKLADTHHWWREHGETVTRFSRDTLAALKARVLVEAFSLARREVVIAGAGKEGGRIARALVALGVRPAAFIDVDPKKIGRTRHGAPTLARDALPAWRARGAFVIAAIGTSGARGVVRAQLEADGFVEGRDAVVVA